jgi:hypothetical protein
MISKSKKRFYQKHTRSLSEIDRHSSFTTNERDLAEIFLLNETIKRNCLTKRKLKLTSFSIIRGSSESFFSRNHCISLSFEYFKLLYLLWPVFRHCHILVIIGRVTLISINCSKFVSSLR